jgi:hypothetical protein
MRCSDFNPRLNRNAFALFSLLAVTLCSAPLQAADAYRFTYRGLQNGDTTVQEVDLDLNLVVSVEQAGQTIN